MKSTMPTGKLRFRLLTMVLAIAATVAPAAAETVVMGASFSIPPYIIRETDQGIEVDILRESFKFQGHTVKIEYLPLARTFQYLEKGRLDGAINVKAGMLANVYYSDVVIWFQNCAISLAKRGYPDVFDMSFLSDKHVIAFQRASTILGPEFGKIAGGNDRYEETAVQKSQLFRLFLERDADVVIMEKKIFVHYRDQVRRKIGAAADQPVRLACIFPPTDYRFAFRDEKTRDAFNAGLQAIRANGAYNRIMERYGQEPSRP